MNAKKPKQRALLYRLDGLPANSLVVLYLSSGFTFRGYISGVSADDLIDLYDHSAAIVTDDNRSTVIDGCHLIAFRVEVPE